MARKPAPQPLAIPAPAITTTAAAAAAAATAAVTGDDSPETSLAPLSAPAPAPAFRSPRVPRSPFRFSSAKLGQSFSDHPSMQPAERGQQTRRKGQPSLPNTDPSLLLARQEIEGRERPSTSPARGGFFSSYKSSKSSSRSQPSESTTRPVEERTSRDSDRPATLANVSAPDAAGSEIGNPTDMAIPRRPIGGHSKSDTPASTYESLGGAQAPSAPNNNNAQVRKHKPKTFSLLNRTRSIRNDKDGQSPNDVVPITITEPERAQTSYGIKTAPLRPEYDRSFREIMNSAPRNRSADRQQGGGRSKEREPKDHGKHHHHHNHHHHHQPMPSRDNGGSSYFNLMKSGSSKAVSMGKGIFSKVGRSYSTTEKEAHVDDEHYVLKVINLPLIEQTRITRISKKLETSRDKTEFWMPAFPWRAIDYLNYRGTETEGLYRVPGSGPQIKKWQRKFDEELDVDLFEQEDLYDINIIGSMLKAWLRELPDELFPKAAQDRIAKECSGSEDMPPQLLIDEISNLPPYNYYLLFAITCHLSLLLAHSDKNKMDFRNLCICFQPCMKIDAFCFKFLVIDWAACWKGCKTEQFWIDQEYKLLDTVSPSSGAESISSTAIESHDERNVSSSDSSQPSCVTPEPSNSRSTSKHGPTHKSISSISSQDTSSTITTFTLAEQTTPRYTGELEPLAPIQPLSPMNF